MGAPELPKRNESLRALLAAGAGSEARRAVLEALANVPSLVLLMRGEAPDGAVRVTKQSGLQWSTVRASGGTTLIAAFTDVEAVGELPPGTMLGSIAPAELFRVAKKGGMGVMINPAGPDHFGILPAAVP